MNGEKEIKVNIIKFALAIHLAVFGIFGLEGIGISVSILKGFIFFIYLLIVPGILILRLQGIKLNLSKMFLLTIGMSLVFVTFLSTLMNFFLITVGFERPISKIPIFASISAATLSLSVLCYFQKKQILSFSLKPSEILSPLFLSFLLLPIISVLAAYMAFLEKLDFCSILFLLIIAFIPVVVTLDKLPEKYYPLILLSSSTSLTILRFGSILFNSHSLREDGMAGVVKVAGLWVHDFPATHNSLL
ncbi:MAG: hypothetical protein N3A69_05845, partial [Leptospiraceae bacterium]|nr:hypothetical protein [Leptospiraceae bacterium]